MGGALGAIAGLVGSVFASGLFGGKEDKAAPEKSNRPDETSEGIAEARRRRRSLASMSGRTGLKSGTVSQGDTRSGLTIQK